MKTIHYISVFAAVCLTGVSLMATSCSDEWDNHYSSKAATSVVDAPTLLKQIKDDPELKQFLRVLETVRFNDKAGSTMAYDELLASPQNMTVFAPVISEEQADSIIAVYENDRSRGLQFAKNRAATQFIQNHLSLYSRSVYESYNDTIRMLNGKYMKLTYDALEGIPFTLKNKVACNGVLYKLSSKETFYPNILEGLALVSELDSVSKFIESFDTHELNTSESVQKGIENGKIVYADSVFSESNSLLYMLGYINREDSSYFFISPTNTVWQKEYAENLPLFKYTYAVSDIAEERDSIARLNARMAIVRGRVFNMNDQKDWDSPKADTITNTVYVRSQGYYGLNVFPKSILSGLPTSTCSNGSIYTDNEGRIDPKLTFKQTRYILASDMRVRTMPQLMVNNERKPQNTVTTRTVRDTITMHYKTVEGGDSAVFYDFRDMFDNTKKNYVEISPITYTGNSNRNSSMYFFLPNTFSGVYYNVYVVMMPAFASTEYRDGELSLPTRFQVYYNERLLSTRFTTSDPNDNAGFAVPTQDKAISAKEGEPLGSGTYFTTTGNNVDIICIDRARQTNYASYTAFARGNNPTETATMRYRITSNVRTSALNKDEMTNTLRIARIIYIPFATEAEAMAFKLNPDLSNIKEYRE